MGNTPTYSHQLKFKESGSTSRTENPSTSISESLTDYRLPQELVTEILLRLPVISLLKSKCVSKSWMSLISSPQFIKSHFSRSSVVGEYLNHQLLFTVDHPISGFKQCSLYSALHEPSTNFFDVAYPSQSPDQHPWIVGVVNGLICVAINLMDLFLWNPVLRKYKHLASSNVSLQPHTFVNYGFGYDESNDDYKVVCLLTVYGSEGYYGTEANVYSLRNDSWRRNEDHKGFLPMYNAGKYANGKIYWSTCNLDYSTENSKIVSLDMASEKYEELQQPDYEAGDYNCKFMVFSGRPSVLCDYYKTKADLWVMDEVEESWCKLVSIPYDDDVYPLKPFSHHRVLCILSDGDIVLENGFDLLVYNFKQKEFRIIELDVFSLSYYEVPTYVESLVSPNLSCL